MYVTITATNTVGDDQTIWSAPTLALFVNYKLEKSFLTKVFILKSTKFLCLSLVAVMIKRVYQQETQSVHRQLSKQRDAMLKFLKLSKHSINHKYMYYDCSFNINRQIKNSPLKMVAGGNRLMMFNSDFLHCLSPSHTFTVLAPVELRFTPIYQIVAHRHDS